MCMSDEKLPFREDLQETFSFILYCSLVKWIENSFVAISIGHILHLVTPQHQFIGALCALVLGPLSLRDPSRFFSDERRLIVVKEMPSEVAPKCEGCVDAVWRLIPEVAKMG